VTTGGLVARTVPKSAMFGTPSVMYLVSEVTAMTSDAVRRANRLNALCSTGPRTQAGKAIAARNRTTCGLFASTLVIEAAGETAADWEAFRAAVLDDLRPVGVVEAELAADVAGLLWRRRRVAAYESAAITTRIGELPPDPDAVQPELTRTGIDPPVTAPATVRLAHLRGVLRISRGRLAEVRVAAALLVMLAEEPADRPIGADVGQRVVQAAGAVFGWAWQPGPWAPILETCGLTPTCVWGRAWTAGELRAVLAQAAAMTGRDPVAFPAEVAAQLDAEVRDAEQAVAAREHAEGALVGEMRAARARVAAIGLIADDKVVDRVIRAEAHLNRQLERAVALLERVQERRRNNEAAAAESAGAIVIGFDLPRLGLTAGDATPRPVGVLRAVNDDVPANDPAAGPIDRTVATVG
jgi:hypothetical protein